MGTDAVIRAAAIVLAAVAAGIVIGTGVAWLLIEIDDGVHDIFGSQLPAADYRVHTPQRHTNPPALVSERIPGR